VIDDAQPPPPVYSRVLGLRHLRLARWQTGVLFDGALVVGVLLALAELASAWAPVVLPAVVAGVVWVFDVVAGLTGPLPDPARSGGSAVRGPDAERPER